MHYRGMELLDESRTAIRMVVAIGAGPRGIKGMNNRIYKASLVVAACSLIIIVLAIWSADECKILTDEHILNCSYTLRIES